MSNNINDNGLEVTRTSKNSISISFDGRYIANISLNRFTHSGKVFGTVSVWDVDRTERMKTTNGQKGIMIQVEQE